MLIASFFRKSYMQVSNHVRKLIQSTQIYSHVYKHCRFANGMEIPRKKYLHVFSNVFAKFSAFLEISGNVVSCHPFLNF